MAWRGRVGTALFHSVGWMPLRTGTHLSAATAVSSTSLCWWSQGAGGRWRPRIRTMDAVFFEPGRPVLIAPPSPPQRMGEKILIAWNGSTEQARTTAFAMPLLKKASHVVVLTVQGGTVPGPTGEELARYLHRNDVVCEPITVQPEGRSTGDAILAHAASLQCDLLIKGAYTQSRLRQMIFGGATRHILANPSLPVLMAH